MRVYLDTGSLAEMEKHINSVQGVTTNPSLMKAQGITNYREFAKEALRIAVGKPVSLEVLSDSWEMRTQALQLAALGPHAVVKIPIRHLDGSSCAHIISDVASDGTTVNVTAVLTPDDFNIAAATLKHDPRHIISVFCGRIADTGRDPEKMIRKAGDHGCRLLWASAREPYNVVQAQRAGYDIITLSPAILTKWREQYDRPLEDVALDTVRQFARDAEGITL